METSRMSLSGSITVIVLAAIFCAAATAQAASDLIPGSYRCSAYNVSGGGGSCRNMPRLELRADGTYRYSSSSGRWSVKDGKLILSRNNTWGPGEILGGDSVRFEYDYRGWHHTVTWICQECPAAKTAKREAAGRPGGGYVGVTLTLQFREQVGGVSGYTIVPMESARDYTHNAPLPEGAVQGLAWEAGSDSVRIATNRDNRIMSGRRYAIFLSWPRESIPVAVLDLPGTDQDYTATIPATLKGMLQ